ncbi:odorant receptor 63a-like [Temnothorax curvispinosus]|uniref:Odorant receptor n=1 Tax=Temnothorax curvispinosus TaxID=300111 RepID=A0A6J1PNQ0_9HYME|nr:odorant receptor 63a-like [Temnothorax curvispinosus]
MDFNGDYYYKLNRIFLSTIGLWPHRYITLRQIQCVVSSFILISVTFFQLLRLITTKYDVDLVLRVLSSALPFMLFTVKYITFYFVTENIKELMQQIHNDWNALKDNNELKIIHRYAKAARLFTTSLAILIYVCILMVICIQYVPIFLDIIMPLNKSRQTELLFQVEYFLDQEKYFHTIQFHLDVGLIVAAMTILSTESFCLTLAIHAFGMFKITSYRMERIIDKSAPNTFVEKYYVFHNNIVTAVNGHRRAIEFSEIVKSTFAIPYLALILLGVTSSSVNLFLLFQVIMSSTTMDDLIRCIIFVFCHFIYMFSTNYAGQKFIDHDADIYKKICNIQWYDAPLRTQKQILFIIQKTIKSYHIDIGGLYSPSLEGFTMLASTSLSYFTVLCSIQK